jgi:hypothetical protein
MSAIKTSLLALIVALTRISAEAEEAPEIGGRTPDGFVVKCYWTGVFDKTQWFGGQGVIGTFGQLGSSPLNGTQESHAFFFATQEVDDRGQMRIVVRDSQWSSTVSHLHYWSKENDKPGAGPGGNGSGAISAADLQVSATDGQKTAKGQGTVNLSVNINTTSDAYKFDVRYHPLEMQSVVRVKVSSKIKSTKWDLDIFSLSVGDEPIKPHQTTTIRREWDIPGTNFRARWLVLRECDTAYAHLVEPHGTQRQYTFDNANPGVLDISFKASVTPNSAGILKKMQDHVRFKMDGIGSSKIQWNHDNPDGKPIVTGEFLTAKLKFIGLPTKNDDFGKKNVQLLIDGAPADIARVKVFFPKLATNHPGGGKDDPNWFYYWKEGHVCGIAAGDSFDSVKAGFWTGYSRPSQDSNVRLCRLAAFEGYGPKTYSSLTGFGSVQGNGHGKGIKRVAEVLEHERHHIAIYALHGPVDTDADGVTDGSEAKLDGVKSDPSNPDTFNMSGAFNGTSDAAKLAHKVYAAIGDDEVRCRKKELDLKVPYDPTKDWADPGCQSKVPYGP